MAGVGGSFLLGFTPFLTLRLTFIFHTFYRVYEHLFILYSEWKLYFEMPPNIEKLRDASLAQLNSVSY